MKFKEYLKEIFNTDVPIKLQRDEDIFFCKFKVKDVKYTFRSEVSDYTNEDVPIWVVMFAAYNAKDIVVGDTGLTGTGNAAEVFAGVKKCMDKFMRIHDPLAFYFSADSREPSRVKLYNRMSKMLAKKYDYNLKTRKRPTGDIEYRFKR